MQTTSGAVPWVSVSQSPSLPSPRPRAEPGVPSPGLPRHYPAHQPTFLYLSTPSGCPSLAHSPHRGRSPGGRARARRHTASSALQALSGWCQLAPGGPHSLALHHSERHVCCNPVGQLQRALVVEGGGSLHLQHECRPDLCTMHAQPTQLAAARSRPAPSCPAAGHAAAAAAAHTGPRSHAVMRRAPLQPPPAAAALRTPRTRDGTCITRTPPGPPGTVCMSV